MKKRVTFEEVCREMKKSIDYFSYYVSGRSTMSFDDVKQELLLRIFKAMKRYRINKGAIKTYFVACLRKEAKRQLRKYYRYSKHIAPITAEIYDRVFVNDKYEIDEVTYFSNNSIIRGHTNIESKILEKEELQIIKNQLTERALTVFCMLENGMKRKHIAAELKTTKGNICNVIRRRIRPLI